MKNIKSGITISLQACLMITLALVLQLASSAAVAQLPELALPSAISGDPTTAKFFGGATADNGVTYGNSFAYDQAIDVLTEIRVEAAHVNTMGNLYIIIKLGETYFIRNETGGYQIWDFTLGNLVPASPAKTLQVSEPLTIVQDIALGPLGVSNATLNIFLAYDTMAAPGEIFYSGSPLNVSIDAEVVQQPSLQLFVDNISGPLIQSRCIACHTTSGIASAAVSTSRLQYLTNVEPDFQQTNYETLVDFINNIAGGSDLLLSKPQGINHLGGIQLVDPSSEFQKMQEFINAVLSE